MLVSIITPSYNSAATIADTCSSIRSQTHQNIEHIVIDGKSSDTTLQVVRTTGRLDTRVVSEKDNGIYDAMNKGLSLATGDVIGILNSDDLLAHNRVIEHIAHAFSDRRVGACFADLAYIDQDDPGVIRQIWRPGKYQSGSLGLGWTIPHPTLYIRRQLRNDIGFFNECFQNAADYDFIARLFLHHDTKIVYLPEIIVKMRLGGASNGNIFSLARQNAAIIRSMKVNHISISPLFPIYKILVRIQRRLHRL